MMALEQQQPLGRPRVSPNRGEHQNYKSNTENFDPLQQLPLLPPPPQRKSPSRSPLTRRSSTPCHVGSMPSVTNKISTSKPSTPTATQLSIRRSKKSSKRPQSGDHSLTKSYLNDNGCEWLSKGLSQTTSSGSLSSNQSSIIRPQNIDSPTLILFSPTSSVPSNNTEVSNLAAKPKHRYNSPIRLDPPPTRKSKSQSPSRAKCSIPHNSHKSVSQCSTPQNTPKVFTHSPVQISRSVPSKKYKDAMCPLRSPIKTSTLLNGFVSTPPTPTVTITPTSSPPKPFNTTFDDFSQENTTISKHLIILKNNMDTTNNCQSTPARLISSCRQSGIGGFEGNQNSFTEKWITNIPILPPPPSKSKPTLANLLNLENNSQLEDIQQSVLSTTSVQDCPTEGNLQLPDLPDLTYSGASSSEGADSPFKLPSSPVDDSDCRLHPGTPKSFNWFNPSDLSADELREFAMKWGSPHHAKSSHTMLLTIPPPSTVTRPRVTSLPASNYQDTDEENEECYRLRHFSIIGTGIVNRGDSMKTRRSKSNACALEHLT